MSAIEKTTRFKISNYDDFIEIDNDYGSFAVTFGGTEVDITPNAAKERKAYLLAVAEMFTRAAESLED